ncbi:MAG TPA: ATP-binding protein, partial [Micromonosporaceae bacterium]
LIDVELSDDGQFTVRVIDRAPVPANGSAERAPVASVPTGFIRRPDDVDVFGRTEDEIDALSEEDVAVGMGLTLLAGLVDDLAVRPAQLGAGTEVEMSWPTGIHR